MNATSTMRYFLRPNLIRPQLVSKGLLRSPSAFNEPLQKRLLSSFSRTPSSETRTSSSILAALRGRSVRHISSQPVGIRSQTQPLDWTKLGAGAAALAGGALALHLLLNRDTRGPLSPFEASYLNQTFLWTGAGLAITTATARYAFRSGAVYRLMALNPWAFMGLSLVGAFGTMLTVNYTSTDNPLHYVAWAGFSALQGLTLSPMFFIAPAILTRAGLYTVAAVSGICYVGATAQSEQYLYLGGPLMGALCVLIATNLAPMVFPRMAFRTLSLLENVSAYGGVAVFSGFLLYDTQKILNHAKYAQFGHVKGDPVRESVSLILDVINLFTSIVRVLLLQGGNRKK